MLYGPLLFCAFYLCRRTFRLLVVSFYCKGMSFVYLHFQRIARERVQVASIRGRSPIYICNII